MFFSISRDKIVDTKVGMDAPFVHRQCDFKVETRKVKEVEINTWKYSTKEQQRSFTNYHKIIVKWHRCNLACMDGFVLYVHFNYWTFCRDADRSSQGMKNS